MNCTGTHDAGTGENDESPRIFTKIEWYFGSLSAQVMPARIEDASLVPWICANCGTQYSPSKKPPQTCAICEDPRQYVGWEGQRWTTLDTLSQIHRNAIHEEEVHLFSIHTDPAIGIGERAFLVQTLEGNVLWDCGALLDEETRKKIDAWGGIHAIAISHPHYYTTMVEWRRAFGNAPIYLHERDRRWVMRPDANIRLWTGETTKLLRGIDPDSYRGTLRRISSATLACRLLG
jgi:hypothetical protein